VLRQGYLKEITETAHFSRRSGNGPEIGERLDDLAPARRSAPARAWRHTLRLVVMPVVLPGILTAAIVAQFKAV